MCFSCDQKRADYKIEPIDWNAKIANRNFDSTYTSAKTYLSIYSQIYGQNEHRLHDLTVTVGIRNTSELDTLYIDRAEFFDTHGKSIMKYIEKTIFILPMETVEIVIDEIQKLGGTGGNILFKWKMNAVNPTPLFEAVMISTSGQQGLSFTTQGIRID
ncbi:hypothetical protein DNU06_04080 [Putridiphycobacter roseus]|uniref:DUF3124 domain-containing protein n=2 Tax=Putridiphycobacter roseus TaxID=2219161 RepID=A0A2W1NEE9_9FLAO|nr:hypothetical protein DNU06_04080 [Putridiphycobacter roseus]